MKNSFFNSLCSFIAVLTVRLVFANPDFDTDGDGQFDGLPQFDFDSQLTAVIGEGSVGVVGLDYLVAHVDGEIRGIGIASEIPFGPYAGGTAYLATYGSNTEGSEENPGEAISFYFYDGATGETSSLSGTINFVSNTSEGDVSTPVLFPTTDPELFGYVQSTVQAFYFINNITIDGNAIGPNDWVGAFKGNSCVGARKWDTSECGNGICDVPAMGIDATNGTELYMQAGDKPTFKIYDWSDGIYYDAVSNSEICGWESLEFCNLDKLSYSGDLDISNVAINYNIINTYPNPFNPIINIDLNLKENDYLDISIFDINGQEIDKIFTGYKVSGKYNYKWNASHISSGIYFIMIKQLENSNVLMEKICLMK